MRSPSRSGAALAEPLVAVPVPPTPCVSVRPFRFDPTIAVEVPVLRWPRQAAARAEVAERGAPCLLVVAASEPPPSRWTEFEDWVREPLRQVEVLVRATTVARRADVLRTPRLDPLGRLSFRGRTVVLSDSQALVVARLLERAGEIVADDEIAGLFGAGGASTHAEARKTALRRIKDTLAPLGLRVSRVRSAGYLVDRSP
jgi:hypothetical protein